MIFGKKIKKHIPLEPQKTLLGRRRELLDKINQDGTYLPKSILHSDLDRGFLDFVKYQLKTTVVGKNIPMIDILITTQNWAQFTETWNLQDLDDNVSLPFITVIRQPEVKFGTNPAVMYNIPNRKQYFYASVPTWDGQRKGVDVYTIPQPVPVDITYQVKIICNRMRELNEFNKVVIEQFASRQGYQIIKGHYIPIVMNDISDESINDVEKRRYYIQTYSFTMLGFLIDENEFEVSPGVTRVLQLVETNEKIKKQKPKYGNDNKFELDVKFLNGNTSISDVFDYRVDLIFLESKNINSFDVYINGDFFGTDVLTIQINTNDNLTISVVKTDSLLDANIKFKSVLL
jgi:hypothetical protein